MYANVEAGQAARENVSEAMRAMLSEFALRASLTLGDDSLEGICRAALDSAGPMGALELIGTRTAGQPWLVNALCYDACFRHKRGRDRHGRSRRTPCWRRRSG